jgi:hyperosmotically inducible protein
MKHVIIVSLVLAAAGCDRSAAKESANHDNPGAANPAAANAPANTPAADIHAATPAVNTAADNTKKNERDRDPSTLTPGDQGGSEADRTITQKVRQGVVKDDALSITGKNVKIITVDGVVTLRGPVKSDKEKSVIAGIAKGVDGVKHVDNQLEIAAN